MTVNASTEGSGLSVRTRRLIPVFAGGIRLRVATAVRRLVVYNTLLLTKITQPLRDTVRDNLDVSSEA